MRPALYLRRMKGITWSTGVILFSLAFLACGRKSERAAEYNNSIMSLQMDIIDALDLIDSTLKDTMITEERLDYAFSNAQTQVKRAVLAIDSIGSFDKDPSFEEAGRSLFRSYEALVEGDYARLVAIHQLPESAITQAVVDTSNAIVMRLQSRSEAIQEHFTRAQEEFGRKYNLVFE
jgi:hypothetical protein